MNGALILFTQQGDLLYCRAYGHRIIVLTITSLFGATYCITVDHNLCSLVLVGFAPHAPPDSFSCGHHGVLNRRLKSAAKTSYSSWCLAMGWCVALWQLRIRSTFARSRCQYVGITRNHNYADTDEIDPLSFIDRPKNKKDGPR